MALLACVGERLEGCGTGQAGLLLLGEPGHEESPWAWCWEGSPICQDVSLLTARGPLLAATPSAHGCGTATRRAQNGCGRPGPAAGQGKEAGAAGPRGGAGQPGSASSRRAASSCRGLAPPSRADRGVGGQPGPCLPPRRSGGAGARGALGWGRDREPPAPLGSGRARAAGVGGEPRSARGWRVGGGRSKVCPPVCRSVRP